MLSKIGFWAFIIGLILCVVAGFAWANNNGVVIALLVLGLIIGFLNVTAKETMLFLVATIALMVAGRGIWPAHCVKPGQASGQRTGLRCYLDGAGGDHRGDQSVVGSG